MGWAWVLNVTLGHKVMASGTAVNRIFLNRELIIFKFEQSSIACHLELQSKNDKAISQSLLKLKSMLHTHKPLAVVMTLLPRSYSDFNVTCDFILLFEDSYRD